MDGFDLVAVSNGLVDVGLKTKLSVRYLSEIPLHLGNGNLFLVFLLVLPKLGALEVGPCGWEIILTNSCVFCI